MSPSSVSKEPIAIVGSACRFAGGVDSPSKLWKLLCAPKDVRTEIPDTRFSAKGFYHTNGAHHGHSNVMHSYLINDDLSAFDSEFFRINSIEAKAMDPQQRILMEIVFEALESSGHTIDSLRGSDTAVFAGVMTGDYEAMLLRDLDVIPTYSVMGTSRAILSNRIAYFFDWHGAAITIDTACSSSLVAIHNAVQVLRSGDSRTAVACGSNLIMGPESYIIESKVKMLSPDGLSRMWDRDANGYARGDGVAAIVLKTLSAAIADGDHIESIIRETDLNQDGATASLTTPSAIAQKDLIQRTYAKARLNLTMQDDRPQYFEAHGTGTPAGDPIEAQAISDAFFGHMKDAPLEESKHPLYVGSIKTVLGHTEGTAGIAAILKASLAIQNSCIPPNLLFDNLSPTVAPYYDHLEIRRATTSWPDLPQGQPKRASVNSFGFGGTNAHAILESYTATTDDSFGPKTSIFTPFVFSAASEKALRANLVAYASYLEEHPEISEHDLAYTLRERRTTFSHRLALPAMCVGDLKQEIIRLLEQTDTALGVRVQEVNYSNSSKVLGVFTGQGAQSAGMGASLIKQSPLAGRVIQELEDYLGQLPAEDRPTWSLRTEILASAENTHVFEAALSQPLCTAVQIMLVELLKSSGVDFSAVVGHSSGEIAAAYAAGYLTTRDAMYIAYYRGLHCRSSASPNKLIKGAMLAVGTSMEDAQSLCEMKEFTGRINVAAINSSSSVTISGDEDAIEELQIILDDEQKFNQRLHVDQAYHSQHMLPCYNPYIRSLLQVGIKALTPLNNKCTWFSSVYNSQVIDATMKLSDVYWAENMIKPVLFSQALTTAACVGTAFDIILEVGAHPALQRPVRQTLQNVSPKPIPYVPSLFRKEDAVETFSRMLGTLWSHLPKTFVDLSTCETAMSGSTRRYHVLKGLPTYQWNHDNKHWHESRRSRRMRLRSRSFHPLLGDVSSDSAPHHLIWKNILKPSEIEWLKGHQLQNQIVFPAAGYVSTAIEGARILAEGKDICLIEISNFNIYQAIMFEGDDSSIEVLIELSQVSETKSKHINANFTYSAVLGGQDTDFTLAADGAVRIVLGDSALDLLPKRKPTPPHLLNVEESRFYSFMKSLEYNFTGPFRSLSAMKRKLGKARCITSKAMTADAGSMLVHPTELDAAFQSVMLTYSYPGDDQLRGLHLPTSIAKVRVNPAMFTAAETYENVFAIDSFCNREDRMTPASGFSGHLEMYTNGCLSAAIQVDRVNFTAMKSASDADRKVFCKTYWVPSAPDGISAANGIPVTQEDIDLLWVLSRIASYYLRKFDEDVPETSSARIESPLCHYLNYARHMTSLLRSGEHKYAKKEWVNDSLEDVQAEVQDKGMKDKSDVKIMFLVGKTMPQVFERKTTMLEHFRESGLLDEYYAYGFGTKQSALWLSNIVKQITDRHPHLNLLEIGAGTGGATKRILNTIDHDFDSYTFTDISSSFFKNATEIFAPWEEHMVFKVCDIEKDPRAQGFTEGAYDVVIGSLVVHATAELHKTMLNLRRLLKPGGFLVIGEGSNDGPMQAGDGFIFGALRGWWLGVDEGRNLSPFVNVPRWNEILMRTGFSGIDTISPPKFLETYGAILFVSQAIDHRIDFLRDPLSWSTLGSPIRKLAIIGARTEPISQVVVQLQNIFQKIVGQIIIFEDLETIDHDELDADTTILSCSELCEPVFKDITPERWYSFRKLFEIERTALWVTSGRLQDEPFSNMLIGFGRSALHELDGLHLQFLDVPDVSSIDVQMVAETLIRWHAKNIESADILYTAEPELIVDVQGRQLVPRLGPIIEPNDRYNSIQRSIAHQVNTLESMIELKQSNYDCSIRQLPRCETLEEELPDSTSTVIRLSHATLSAIRTEAGYRFLCIGTDTQGTKVLALVSSLTSRVKIPTQAAVPVNIIGQLESTFLALAATHLTALAITQPLCAGQKLAIHNASQEIARAITVQAAEKGCEVTYTTDSINNSTVPSSWIQLPLYLGRSDLSQILSPDIACFVGFSHDDSENELSILAMLSPYCRKETVKTLYCVDCTNDNVNSTPVLTQILSQLTKYVTTAQTEMKPGDTDTFNLESIGNGIRPQNPLTIVEWAPTSSLTARVCRLDNKQLFKSDKTYWLCGMSGALGISLCDWMIEQGVRYLVLSSRNPKVESAWLEDRKRNGITVKIMSCDVTDEEALRTIHQHLVDTLPPIVGVINGAMVLRDSSVGNMDFDQVTDVITPKVLGSKYLDQIFCNVDLDFFILLSSINCVVGNVGQANYAAANMGMCGIAASRRKRGLNSIAINIGAIIGIGYITQSNRQLDQTVAKMALMHLSDTDFHQIIAEAIEAGYVDSPVGPELSTGLLDISPNSPNIPVWFSDPKFTRFIVHQTTSDDRQKEQGKKVSIQERLYNCQTDKDVLQVIREAFATQLRKILQSSMADDDLMTMRGYELGLDSLSSVDIRAWFLKHFLVNIPVLKIMAKDIQMASLAKLATEGIAPELIPQVGEGRESPANNNDKPSTQSSDLSSGLEDSADFSSVNPAAMPDIPSPPDEAAVDVNIDWIVESTAPEIDPGISNANLPSLDPSIILLTGVSGLLGHHLLRVLLEQKSIRKVICIAVRQLSKRLESKQIPPPGDRIVYYEGDLCDRLFGLTDVEAASIFAEVDAVIHNGSDTSHLKYYSAVKQANVISTRQILDYCIPRHIPVHYVSSAGIALLSGKDAFPEVSAINTGILPPADGAHGYLCSKWVNERLLEQVNLKYKLSVWIYRPSTIIREGNDATTTKAEFDWVNALMYYSHRIEAVPEIQHTRGVLDLVYVRSICDDIVRELFNNKAKLAHSVKYINNVGDIVISMDRMVDIGKEKGKMYQVLPMKQWIQKAVSAGLQPAVATLIEVFDDPGAPAWPLFLKNRT